MRKNLTSKAILIVAILLVFVFGIFGIPNGVSGQAWRDALAKRIARLHAQLAQLLDRAGLLLIASLLHSF